MQHCVWWSHQSPFWYMSTFHSTPNRHKPHFSIHSINAWLIPWRMESWIFKNSANTKENNVYSFYSFLCNLTRDVVPVLPTEESYISSDACSVCQGSISCSCPGQCLTENRRKVDVCSLFQIHFSFLTVCQRTGEHYDFSNYSKLSDSLLPWEQRSLKKQNLAELLLLRDSQVTALDKFHLAPFSPLLSYTCSFPQ